MNQDPIINSKFGSKVRISAHKLLATVVLLLLLILALQPVMIYALEYIANMRLLKNGGFICLEKRTNVWDDKR